MNCKFMMFVPIHIHFSLFIGGFLRRGNGGVWDLGGLGLDPGGLLCRHEHHHCGVRRINV